MSRFCQIRAFSSNPGSFYDLVIVGGGLVGSAMACSIGRSPKINASLLVLEAGKNTESDISNQRYNNRVSAISPSSVKLFQKFGIWDDICSKRSKSVSALYVEDGSSDSRIHFKQTPFHPIAYIVENELIVQALHKCIRDKFKGVTLQEGTIVKSLSIPDNLSENVILELEGGQIIETPLLIAADGARSKIRAESGITFLEKNYEQMSIVCTLGIDSMEDDGNSIAYQRFLPLGPVALLPLTNQLSSLVWTTSTDEAKRLLELPDELFIDSLNRALTDNAAHNQTVNKFLSFYGRSLDCLFQREGHAKLRFPRVLSLPFGDRAAFPLSFGYARDYVRPRIALIGDAAHRIHPLAGQGVNLGWSDVRFLTNALEMANSEGGDFGSLTYLREFDTSSQRRNVPIMLAIDCLNQLYSTDNSFSVLLRSVGFNSLNRILPAKDLIVRMAS